MLIRCDGRRHTYRSPRHVQVRMVELDWRSHYRERWQAERSTKRVVGANALANDLEVHLPSGHQNSSQSFCYADRRRSRIR